MPHVVDAICGWCGASFVTRRYEQRYCSYVCGYSARNSKSKEVRKAKPRAVANCLRCGLTLEGKSRKAIYCSKTCKSIDHTFRHRGGTRKSPARRRLIIERDAHTCYMCGLVVPPNRIELDHLIPVAKGGSSDDFNVAVACRSCNRRRGTHISIAQMKKLAELGVFA